MALPKTTKTRYGWQFAGNTEHRRTTQVTPSLHQFLNLSTLCCDYRKVLCAGKKRMAGFGELRYDITYPLPTKT